MNMDNGGRIEGVGKASKCPLTLAKITISEKRNKTKAVRTKLIANILEMQKMANFQPEPGW